MISRREFLKIGFAGLVAASCRPTPMDKIMPAKLPAIISTWEFGRESNRVAAEILLKGGNCLEAVEKGINHAELDPENLSVGYGGLPNEEGQVQLDAMIMYGPTHSAGAVAALRDIPTPISVARKVMEKTYHTLLTGEGALRFALKTGFKGQNLLTEKAKRLWEEWKRGNGSKFWRHDTIGMVVVDKSGDIAAGCSTSGLAFKLAGRVGDSPIIGAGAYCDNDVGGAAATGNGDIMMRFCLSFHVVELMRIGLSPGMACQAVLKRLRDKRFSILAGLVAVNKMGQFGAAAIGIPRFPYAIWNPDLDQVRYTS
jgi:isoaspartyl peptidase/L-asparaginase-like protein (Ntn-hydrolase superfamily)